MFFFLPQSLAENLLGLFERLFPLGRQGLAGTDDEELNHQDRRAEALGLTSLRAITSAIVLASLVNAPSGGKVETVVTL
jgi:hypothetical protein